MKKALITGINGQDGSYLAEFLVKKNYEVHGIIRRSSSFNTSRIEHLYIDELLEDLKLKRKINLHYGDMTDSTNLIRLIQKLSHQKFIIWLLSLMLRFLLTFLNILLKQMLWGH